MGVFYVVWYSHSASSRFFDNPFYWHSNSSPIFVLFLCWIVLLAHHSVDGKDSYIMEDTIFLKQSFKQHNAKMGTSITFYCSWDAKSEKKNSLIQECGDTLSLNVGKYNIFHLLSYIVN